MPRPLPINTWTKQGPGRSSNHAPAYRVACGNAHPPLPWLRLQLGHVTSKLVVCPAAYAGYLPLSAFSASAPNTDFYRLSLGYHALARSYDSRLQRDGNADTYVLSLRGPLLPVAGPTRPRWGVFNPLRGTNTGPR